MGFQPSALRRDQHLAREANLARIKSAVASERSQRQRARAGLEARRAPRHQQHLHHGHPTSSSWGQEGEGTALHVSITQRARIRRQEPTCLAWIPHEDAANLPRGCQRSQPWQQSQGGEATGFSLEAPSRQKKHRGPYEPMPGDTCL